MFKPFISLHGIFYHENVFLNNGIIGSSLISVSGFALSTEDILNCIVSILPFSPLHYNELFAEELKSINFCFKKRKSPS